MANPLSVVLCFALVVAQVLGSSTTPAGTSEPPDVQTVAPTEDDTLQNEADNQENVLSQVGKTNLMPTPLALGDGKDLRLVYEQLFFSLFS